MTVRKHKGTRYSPCLQGSHCVTKSSLGYVIRTRKIQAIAWHGGGRDHLLRIGGCTTVRGLAWERALRQGLGKLRGAHQVDTLPGVRKEIPGRVNCLFNG